MTQNPPLLAGKRDGASAAGEEGWRREVVAGFGKVSGLGQAVAFDDDGGGAADDGGGTYGDGGGDAPAAPRCHTACSRGTLTGSEAPLSVLA